MDDFEKEIKKYKKQIEDLEHKCFFLKDYNLLNTILDKLNVQKLEISTDEVKAHEDLLYVVETKDNKYIVRRLD